MYTAAPPPVPSSLAERIAWMHEPVRLTPGVLPWVLRIIMEAALSSLFRTLEQGILTLLDLQRQGKLTPWPEDAAETEPKPGKPADRLKLTPVAPKRSAGATRVRGLAAREAMVQAAGAEADAAGVALRPTWPLRAQAQAQPRGLRAKLEASVWPCDAVADRCRPGLVWKAAEMRQQTCAQIVPLSLRIIV